MLIKTRGIVFHAKKYSESSLIVDIYTEEKGLRSYIISGVRQKKAKVSASLLQIMSLVEIVAYHRDDRDLTRIKEIKSAHIYQSLPFDVRRSAVGQFMIEIVRKTLRETEENPPLFQFLFKSFQFLDQTEHSFANVHLYFMLELSAFLGFLPGGEYQDETPFFDLKEGYFTSTPSPIHFLKADLGHKMSELLNASLETCQYVNMNRQMRADLLRNLLTYYQLHIENFPTIYAHVVLSEVLE